jgi:hypothetical protein
MSKPATTEFKPVLCWAEYEVAGHENLRRPRPRALCIREAGHEPSPHSGPCPLCDPTFAAKARRLFEVRQAKLLPTPTV